jgi:Protein of unknown function, DUF547
MRLFRLAVPVVLVVFVLAPRAAGQGDRHAVLDHILDTYVRDGLVYYNALKIERASLDRYVQSLDVARDELARWPPADREAFWLNAYDALVLRTVADAYPIRGSLDTYPADSIRQVSGAFDRRRHRVGGELVTLDEIEARLLEEFGDARIVLALGRGARGGGRLRSEAFQPARLSEQLQGALEECAQRVNCVRVDAVGRTLTISPLIGWHAAVFERSFAAEAGDRWPQRSALERAIAAMASPFLFPRERSFLAADSFQLQYGEFDWSLNEL